MHPLDILYISLAICAFLAIGIVGYVAYHIVQTIKSAKIILDDVADVAHDVRGTKEFLKKDVIGRLLGLGRDLLDNHYGQQSKRIATHHARHPKLQSM